MSQYAIVEVMGHRLYAGRTEPSSLAGQPMLRVSSPAWTRTRVERRYLYAEDRTADGLYGDVERDVHESHSEYVVDLGGGALFAVTWCTEADVMAVLHQGRAHSGGSVTVIEGQWRRRGEALAIAQDDEDAEVIETRPLSPPAPVVSPPEPWCGSATCYARVDQWGQYCDQHRAGLDADLAPGADLPREPTAEVPF